MITTSPLTDIARQVCERRYFKKDDDGKFIEDWEGLTERVVNHVCKGDTQEFRESAKNIIYNTEFLPNSPCLVNAGSSAKSKGLLACFVTKSPADSWIGMVENIANYGHVARQGGGCGVDFSKIRPEGDPVFGSTHAKACGPIEHMRMLSEVMSSITQSGFRGMACMGCLRVDHPDVMKFIVCKQRDRALKTLLKEDIFDHYSTLKATDINDHLNIVLDKFISNFNISLFVTDDFMQKVENGEDYDLVFGGKVYDTISARKVFDAIVNNAWQNGDPGMLFYDTINNCPYKHSKQDINATNPCGEQTLPPYGSCNLGSIDVSKFYNESRGIMEWTRLGTAIETAVQFLDNVISVNVFPTNDFENWAKDNRPVGLGIMGWADLLLQMDIAYGDAESFKFANKVGKFFEQTAHAKSVELGQERGTPKCCRYEELENRRNVTTLSIAPTGTISLLAGCSSSIEPVFNSVTYRYDNTGSREIRHPYAKKNHFRCASDLTWDQHINMQAAFQPYINSAISKTINFSNDATKEDVANAYLSAWKTGCKGITVYRDGCKTTQVLNTTSKGVGTNQAKPRPKEVPVDIFRTRADGFEWHILVGKVDGVPYEIFAVNGKQELPDNGIVVKKKRRHYSLLSEDRKTLIENIGAEEDEIHPDIALETRRCSLELRHNIPPKDIIKQIDKCNKVVTSFSKASGRVLKKYVSADDLQTIDVPCPDCARSGKEVDMIPEAGCWKCPECYYSRCS